jgi:hypothetical protein
MFVFECCCCFVETNINNVISCNLGHISCIECINKAVQIAVGNNDIVRCFDQSECDEIFNSNIISRAICNEKLKVAYNNVVTNKSVSKIENLYKCNYCEYAVIIEENLDFFDCINCKKLYCFKCKKDFHENSPCNPEEHIKEDNETEKYVLKCCNTEFIRHDGCNKVTCPQKCGKLWCWTCKVEIKSYEHFKKGICPMYGELPSGSCTTKRCKKICKSTKVVCNCIIKYKTEFCGKHNR